MKIIFIFSCSGMFRNVPCSWFYRRPFFSVNFSLERGCLPLLARFALAIARLKNTYGSYGRRQTGSRQAKYRESLTHLNLWFLFVLVWQFWKLRCIRMAFSILCKCWVQELLITLYELCHTRNIGDLTGENLHMISPISISPSHVIKCTLKSVIATQISCIEIKSVPCIYLIK